MPETVNKVETRGEQNRILSGCSNHQQVLTQVDLIIGRLETLDQLGGSPKALNLTNKTEPLTPPTNQDKKYNTVGTMGT